MAGTVRTGAYLPQMPLDTDPQLTDRAFPDIPRGYPNWNAYVLDVLRANDAGSPGPRPYNVYGGDSIGNSEMQPLEWLINSLGYGRLAPYLDQSDPRIQTFLDSTYYSNTSHDAPSIWGDQFAQALMGLGLATGGAAAFGAFSPAAAAPAAGALAPGELGLEALFPAVAGAAGPGVPAAAVAGGAGALGAGAAGAGGAGGAGGIAGGVGAGLLGSGAADWLTAATAAAGLGNAIYSGVKSGQASGDAADAAQLQAQIAEQLFNEASPLRQANLGQLGQFATTGQLPIALRAGLDPLYATGREGLEDQYNVARENIISRIPGRGGQLNRQLADLELARAGQVGRLRSDILGQYEIPMRQNLFQLGVNAGLGQSTQGLQGLGTSANNFMQLAQSAGQQAGQAGQASGALLALLLRQQQMNQNPLTGQQAGGFGSTDWQPYMPPSMGY